MRLNLLTPDGTLVQADTYNRLFTLHGVIMVLVFPHPRRSRQCSEIF